MFWQKKWGNFRKIGSKSLEKYGLEKPRGYQHGKEVFYCHVVINKGPDRDIDRDAVNMLITFLLDGEYQMIVVDKLTDLTSDLSDLEEFLNDAAAIGVSVLELSTMQKTSCVYGRLPGLFRYW